MPEDQSFTHAGLERLLDDMKDFSLQVQNYQSIQKALEAANSITVPVIKKILLICVCDLKEDVKSTLNGLNILCTLLKKIKETACSPLPDLVPSAVVVLRMLKTTALFNKVESLKMLCFEIMTLYPDETLISLVVDQSNELLELFNLYCHQRIPPEIRIQPICLVTTLLKVLPPDKKATFVKEGLNIWFSKIIPTVVICPSNHDVLEALELLTEEIVKYEYADNQHWKNVLACIYTPQKYPAIMKSLLEQGSDTWHRLWIVFIKLLKSQITKNTNTAGSPINSMLPVVEMAFKMDIPNRCRAFKCWNVLIDNFSSETNEVYLNKRIKLLIIPLISNNAKVEETALAKLKTWWHLISCFYLKINNFSEIILIPFLYFCFGKPASDKPTIIPGMISNHTKIECVKVFINIIGHGNCNGCVEYPKFKENLVNTKFLVSHWVIWIHSLSSALRICTENDFKEEQIECFWKTFIMTVGELPENNVRRDLYNEVLAILENLSKDETKRRTEVITNILIPTLFESSEKIRPLLKSDIEENSPVTRILSVQLRLSLSEIENRVNLDKLKSMTDYLVHDALRTSSHTIEWLLKDLSSNNVLLWIALSHSICKRKYSSCPRMLCKMLLWPFKHIDTFVRKNESIASWLEFHKYFHPILDMTEVNTDILNALLALNGTEHSTEFIFDIILVLVQQKLNTTEGNDLDKEVQLLYKLTSNLNDQDIHSVLPKLSDVIVSICGSNTKTVNEKIAKNVVLTVANVLKACLFALEKSNTEKTNIINNVKKIIESLQNILKIECYSELKSLLEDDLKNLAPFTKNEDNFNKITSAMYKYSHTTDKFSELTKAFENYSNTDDENAVKKPPSQDKFPTPSTKVAKKNKKKETSIVNTVVENGEEFVVVKSNWKFNPRKLTDNQKEKLQRKREDIPALYQDLSQSQDEFKLSTWKCDSTDSSTASKSTTVQGNEDANAILKNIPNSEFVPKMLENIIGKERDSELKAISGNETDKLKNDQLTRVTNNKDAKSPRMALKDRVFRNVRNLLEKSNVSENDNNSNIMGNVSKTPAMTKTKSVTNLFNSAPSHINADRPSRVKRKPKKFIDLEITSLKRKRSSTGHSESPSDGEATDSPVEDINSLKESVKMDKIVEHDLDTKDIDEESTEKADKESKTFEEVRYVIIQEHDTIENEEKIFESIDNKNKMDVEEKQTIEILIDDKTIQETPSQTLDTELCATPKTSEDNKVTDTAKSSKKKTKLSRIKRELEINMDDYPTTRVRTKKRLTSKEILNTPCTSKNMSPKLNKNKTEPKSATKGERKAKDLNASIKQTQITDDIVETQDVIESSQESTVTTMSVKPTKKSPVALLEKATFIETQTQNMLEDTNDDNTHSDSKHDDEFSRNKTSEENVTIELTEDMSTQSVVDQYSEGVIVINDEEDNCMEDIKNKTVILETQNTADSDTQSMDPNMFVEINDKSQQIKLDVIPSEINKSISRDALEIDVTNASTIATPDDATKTMTDSVLADEACSSFKDEEQRKKDFLNNTLEISPIKILSPVRDKKTPSPETSSDYVVVILSSPVNINGEPFSKCESPEIFTEDKVSLDARDLSPPREEIQVPNSNHASSLSLKKNKPQVRSGGRAAQMLGLCVPDRIQAIITSDKSNDIEDFKKSPSINTSARRNLRILYNSTNGENIDTTEPDRDSEEGATFLKFERSIPSVDCSPSVPILKRKLAEITDDTTASPASKRKRVSFHDPPVSTTICVKKYIEPSGVRSPQNSAIKRQERQLRLQLPTKSPKRLDNVFKLDSVLTKTVESFADNSESTEDTEMSSPDETPALEVFKTSDLNDTDPICIELVNCEDPITNVATELSSPTMKTLLVKEFEGRVATIGDLAKMTELEVNRLCIKAPKVEVAKRVLSDYFTNIEKTNEDKTSTIDPIDESKVPDVSLLNASTEVQINEVTVENMEMQTDKLEVSLNGTQTESVQTNHCSVQTNESGQKTTADMVTSCLKERKDFIQNICEKMDEISKQKIADNLSFNALSEVIMKKFTSPDSNDFLNRVIEHQSKLTSTNDSNSDKRLSVVQDYLCNSFESNDLILFCSNLLRKVHEKPL